MTSAAVFIPVGTLLYQFGGWPLVAFVAVFDLAVAFVFSYRASGAQADG